MRTLIHTWKDKRRVKYSFREIQWRNIFQQLFGNSCSAVIQYVEAGQTAASIKDRKWLQCWTRAEQMWFINFHWNPDFCSTCGFSFILESQVENLLTVFHINIPVIWSQTKYKTHTPNIYLLQKNSIFIFIYVALLNYL